MFLRRAIVALCCTVGLFPTSGQDCRIAGRITGARNEPVGLVVVSVTRLDSGARLQVLANARGGFLVGSLLPGDYRIDAVKPGFEPLSRTAASQCFGSAATLDLQMTEANPAAESLVAYICNLSRGSGCELIDAGPSGQ